MKFARLIQLAVLATLLAFPLASYATTCSFTVSGAGTAAVNGTYTLLTSNSFSISGGGTFGMLNQAAYSLNGATVSAPVLVVTSGATDGSTYNATELRGLTSGGLLDGATGYYYAVGQAANPTNYPAINTINVAGSAPVPTIVANACATAAKVWFNWGALL